MRASANHAASEVRCLGLSKSYGAVDSRLEAVASLDITFEGGRTTALVGPSGSGKSTILRLVAGLEDPSSGEVTIGGRSPAEVQREGGLAMAFQDPSLLPWRTLRGNIALARKLARMPADPEAIDRLIDLVGLSGFEEHRPAELSGGMRQRAAIARCLATEPSLLLLDEPFGAVDELTRARLNRDLPRLWQQRGATALFVTHSVSEAVFVCDRVLVVSDRPARIVADIAVPFAQPRGASLRRSTQFRDLVDQVGTALQEGAESEDVRSELVPAQ